MIAKKMLLCGSSLQHALWLHIHLLFYAERPWNESLSARIAQVQDCYKNIPPKLYFSPSSVSFEGIGVYAAEPLPQGITNYYSNFYVWYTLFEQ